MKKRSSTNHPWAGCFTLTLMLCLCFLPVTPILADVDMTLYNTVAMLNADSSTPLSGDAGSGCLVQLIAVGPNGVIDVASTNSPGSPSVDDYLLTIANNPTHIGAGMPSPGTGKFVQSGMIYSNSLVGLAVYVRYWNEVSPGAGALYGNSVVFNLPAADSFGQAEVDFIPSGSSTPYTNYGIPTLSEWGMLVLVLVIAFIGMRKMGNPLPRANDG